MLHVEKEGQLVKQYLRDPQGVFDIGRLLETYAEGVELPPDATDSAYRSPEGFELWFTASDRAAYVVTPRRDRAVAACRRADRLRVALTRRR
jgi:hypothetical protein